MVGQLVVLLLDLVGYSCQEMEDLMEQQQTCPFLEE